MGGSLGGLQLRQPSCQRTSSPQFSKGCCELRVETRDLVPRRSELCIKSILTVVKGTLQRLCL